MAGLPIRRDWLVEGGLLALVVAAAAALFAQGPPTPADYDEGSYLTAVDALRHGQTLGAEIFTPQPPGFYYLLAAADAVLGSSLGAIRAGIIVLAVAGCLGAFLLCRTLGGPVAGVVGAALLAVSAPYWQFSFRISADLPALAVALFSLWCAAEACRRRGDGVGWAAAAGALFTAAVSIKLSALTLLIPLAGYAAATRAGRRSILAFGAGALGVALPFLLVSLGELGGIWRGAVSYHRAARNVGPGLWSNVEEVAHFLDPRTRNALVWSGALAIIAWIRLRRARDELPLWPLWLWGAFALLFLGWHRPLHDNHKVLIAVTLAPAAAATIGRAIERLPRREALAALAVMASLLVFGYVRDVRELTRNQGPQPAEVLWAAEALERRTEPQDLVAADRPIVAYLAGRRIPGELVDTAYLRFRSGYLTDQEVLETIDERRVRAVVAARAFRDRPALLLGLRKRFPTRIRHLGVTLYLRAGAPEVSGAPAAR